MYSILCRMRFGSTWNEQMVVTLIVCPLSSDTMIGNLVLCIV